MLSLLLACATPQPLEDTAPIDTAVCDTEGIPYLPPVPPNVMLVVDRSGSMDQPAPGCSDDCPSRWEALMSLAPLVDGMNGVTRTGLTLYPDAYGQTCDADHVEVPLDLASGDAILQTLATSQPGGSTPIAEALETARMADGMQDDHRDRVVVLLTDGVPTCLGPQSSINAAARIANDGIQLHVVSFNDSTHQPTLEQMAEAAVSSSGPDNFHYANSVEGLLERLARVTASLSPCAYALEEDVPADQLTVYVHGERIEVCDDCTHGYAYDPDARIVTLAPGTCRDAATDECPDVVFEREG